MFEYQEWKGMIYGVFSLLLIIGVPVAINRLLKIKYPIAIFTLLIICNIFMLLDSLIHSLIFDLPIIVDPLNEVFVVLVPIYVFAISLIIDVVITYWFAAKKQKSAASVK